MAEAPAIELSSLTKRYGNHRGIEELTLDVRPGEVLGFLGPNGAGKTTAIRTLLGFLKPTSGSARVLGLDVVRESVEVRRHVGYLPGDPVLYGGRTGWELLQFATLVRNASAPLAERIVAVLKAPMERDVKKASRGMRQKVALVLALAHDPEVIILDEPTAGLDPLGQRALLGLIMERSREGRTVLLSSHILSEVEQVCDRVAILREGRLATLSTVEELRSQKYREVTVAYSGDPPSLDLLGEFEVVWQHGNRMTFRVRADASKLLQALAGANLTDVTITEPTLEEVFLGFYKDNSE